MRTHGSTSGGTIRETETCLPMSETFANTIWRWRETGRSNCLDLDGGGKQQGFPHEGTVTWKDNENRQDPHRGQFSR